MNENALQHRIFDFVAATANGKENMENREMNFLRLYTSHSLYLYINDVFLPYLFFLAV